MSGTVDKRNFQWCTWPGSAIFFSCCCSETLREAQFRILIEAPVKWLFLHACEQCLVAAIQKDFVWVVFYIRRLLRGGRQTRIKEGMWLRKRALLHKDDGGAERGQRLFWDGADHDDEDSSGDDSSCNGWLHFRRRYLENQVSEGNSKSTVLKSRQWYFL